MRPTTCWTRPWERHPDTHGVTPVVFALFDLLGLQLSPRTRDVGKIALYGAWPRGRAEADYPSSCERPVTISAPESERVGSGPRSRPLRGSRSGWRCRSGLDGSGSSG
ncbi:Tn3 family transposase [Microbispora sp. NPDC049125]|uniref:Tn3 family transposase n=1 Tax=Microbispora sp. NPDC049125 TaxID=3154929 RepID=UPI0034659DA5